MRIYGCIIVGSGATGSIAAHTLVEKGIDTLLLDAGLEDTYGYEAQTPDNPFSTIRLNETDQHSFFLGKDYEGLGWGPYKVGSQLTPSRLYHTKRVDELIPFRSANFQPMESLAKGGLSGAWGTGCHVYSKQELALAGLPADLDIHYQEVADLIGISGAHDDAAPYTVGNLARVQPPVPMEENLDGLYASYFRKRDRLNKQGIFLGKTGIATLTQPHRGREANRLHDMDFWSDHGKSCFRGRFLIEELSGKQGFEYLAGFLVLSFAEDKENEWVEVTCLNLKKNQVQVFRSKRLLLCPGVLGSARIVLRSFHKYHFRLPLLCNPFGYQVCLQPRRLGKSFPDRKTSLCQLIMFFDPEKNNTGATMISLYSYRSLLLFKLMKEAPVNFADGRILFRYLEPALLIAGIHHTDSSGNLKYIELIPDGSTPSGDLLSGSYSLDKEEQERISKQENKIKGALRMLGAFPLKKVTPKAGASIHYAGVLPFSATEKEMHLAPNGRLYGTSLVYVGDGSGFNYLPAKGLTLTLMANAHRVAGVVAASITPKVIC